MTSPKDKSEEEWKKELTKEQFKVLRLKGTERPFTGELLNNKAEGIYRCAGCDTPLFSSNAKFDSGSGWPSFSSVLDNDNIDESTDTSHSMVRTEVLCKKCGGHLGHVFNDGPKPTGLRYCINSVALTFDPAEEEK